MPSYQEIAYALLRVTVGVAVLMMALTFGTVVEPDPVTAARNVNYALILFVLLFLARYNALSLDRARGAGPGSREEYG